MTRDQGQHGGEGRHHRFGPRRLDGGHLRGPGQPAAAGLRRAITDASNRDQGHRCRSGQLNLTTEVENFPGLPWPASYASLSRQSPCPMTATPTWPPVRGQARTTASARQRARADGLMRQQAVNFGTRIITDDIVKVDFKRRPFTARDPLRAADRVETLSRHRRHRRPGQLPRPAVGRPLQEQRRLGLCRLRRRPAALPQQAAGRGRRRRHGRRGGDLPDQVRQHRLPGPSPRRAAAPARSCRAGMSNPKIDIEVEPRPRRGARQRQGRRHRRPAEEHGGRQHRKHVPTSAASSWRSATRRTPTSSTASWSWTPRATSSWTKPQRTYTSVEGRLRGRRRGRQLLPPGGHGGRHAAAWPPWTRNAGWPRRARTDREGSVTKRRSATTSLTPESRRTARCRRESRSHPS